MSRWKAAGLHLLLSILVVGGIALSVYLLWYPHGLYRLSGQGHLLLMMLAIDMVAGPLLTLVVFKVGKPRLRLDLSVIAVFQLAFMAYGLHTLWLSRPVFLVASDVRFNLVFANEIDPLELAKAPRPAWRRLSWTGPVLVGVQPPRDEKERQDLLFLTLDTGIDIDKLPRLYVDYGVVKPALLKASTSERPEQRCQLPVVSRYAIACMRLDPETGEPLSLVQRRDDAAAAAAGAG